MGYDLQHVGTTFTSLSNESGYFRWNIWGWPQVLGLAEKYGWEPQGTIIRDEDGDTNHDWDGTYYSNSGQIVNAFDAKNLADALEQALPFVLEAYRKGSKAATGEVVTIDDAEAETELADTFAAIPVIFAGKLDTPDPEVELAGDHDYLRDFIKYCRTGAFEIW